MDRQNGAQALMEFTWERQPEAEKLVRELVSDFLQRCPEAKLLSERMTSETGTRFVDWVDYIVLPERMHSSERLSAAGYVDRHDLAGTSAYRCWMQPNGVFPLIAITSDPKAVDSDLAIKVESIADFSASNQVFFAASPYPFSPIRRLGISSSGKGFFFAVERHGFRGTDAKYVDGKATAHALWTLEKFRCRSREKRDEAEVFADVESQIDAAIELLGRDLTCDLFFAAERDYWQRRNRAAQFQKARQDRLGLGWANHDHHTYRCSRKYFSRLIGLWEKLGFQLRERFYAGAEAGWGAQVCEQPNAGIITFNDVDLSPEELLNDFSHDPLPERKELGTVGLWCALHGESFLQAGMHHLECQFDFEALKKQMEGEGGIKVMKPFTDFPHLRQAFTEGERWPVKEDRLQRLLANGQITAEQATQFRTQGAIGSHLENLERNEGFKGFNQKGVSEIIAKTDPRKNV